MACQVGFPGSCNAPQTLDGFNQSPSPHDDSAFTSYFTENASAKVFKGMTDGSVAIPEVKCGDAIELNNGQVTSALTEIENEFNKNKKNGKWTVLLPVIDCADLKNNPVQKAKVLGFATVCITDVDAAGSPKSIKGSLDCSAQVSGTPSSTSSSLFGTYATAPILIK
jgi:hypothetical protein